MRVKISAIFAGVGTWILSLIVFTIVNFLFISQFYLNKSSSDLNFNYDVAFGYFLKLISISGYVFSGFIAARVAKRDELLHGFVLGTLLCLVSWTMTIVQIKLMKHEFSLDFLNLLLSLSTIVGCLVGAYIQQRIREKKTDEYPLEKRIDNLGQE